MVKDFKNDRLWNRRRTGRKHGKLPSSIHAVRTLIPANRSLLEKVGTTLMTGLGADRTLIGGFDFFKTLTAQRKCKC
jgi:hypothetical protein